MKKNLIKIITAFSIFIFIVSCDRTKCTNTNVIFDKFTPETKEYKDELLKQISKVDKTKLTYWMKSYQENDNSQSINVNIQGDSLCAVIALKIS